MLRLRAGRLVSTLTSSEGLGRVQHRSAAALVGKNVLASDDDFTRGVWPAYPSAKATGAPRARQFSTTVATGGEYRHDGYLIEPSDLFGPRPDSWWTGRRPSEKGVPGMREDGRVSSLPQLMLSRCTKQDYFDNTWMLTESLFAGLQGEAAFMRPPSHELRHPMVFYYGHTAALYVNKLRAAGIVQAPINPLFEALLETGVDEMAWDDVGNSRMEWPSIAEVHAYREEVYKLVTSVIQTAPDEAISNINMDSPYWALPMGMEHERIHVETSSVLIRELPLEYVARPATWPKPHAINSSAGAISTSAHSFENPLVRVEGGVVKLGKPDDFPSFGWDNEYGSREFSVPSFEASKHMVSNGEYLEFVKDAGYARQELWTDIGWRWKMFRNVKKPHFWVSEGPSGFHQYYLRTIFDEVPLPMSAPVLVNFHEAKAFAAWKTLKEKDSLGDEGRAYRLTTELEHNILRGTTSSPSSTKGDPEVIDPVLSTDEHVALGGAANFNLTMGSETPGDKFPPNSKGFCDTHGNAWEWCEDHFSALNGFKIHPLYEDFSTPCFDGEHNLIVGGSFASTGNEASAFSRYHFRPHFHQHAGFRLVAPEKKEEAEQFVTSCTDAGSPFVGSYPFRTSGKGAASASGWTTRQVEANRSITANLALHYAVPDVFNEDTMVVEGLQYPQRCAHVVLRALQGIGPLDDLRVVDVGCGAGGASFELSKGVGKVVALEANKKLLDIALQVASEGRLALPSSSVKVSGLTQDVHLVEGANPSRITFKQCDPMCLPADLTGLDAALIHSAIDTIPSPSSLLARMGGARGIVRQNGGLVVVVSAYEWNEEVTPVGSWLGGYLDENGNKASSVQGLSRGLGKEFKLVHVEKMPRMRPLSDCTFEYALAEATVWRRE